MLLKTCWLLSGRYNEFTYLCKWWKINIPDVFWSVALLDAPFNVIVLNFSETKSSTCSPYLIYFQVICDRVEHLRILIKNFIWSILIFFCCRCFSQSYSILHLIVTAHSVLSYTKLYLSQSCAILWQFLQQNLPASWVLTDVCEAILEIISFVLYKIQFLVDFNVIVKLICSSCNEVCFTVINMVYSNVDITFNSLQKL